MQNDICSATIMIERLICCKQKLELSMEISHERTFEIIGVSGYERNIREYIRQQFPTGETA